MSDIHRAGNRAIALYTAIDLVKPPGTPWLMGLERMLVNTVRTIKTPPKFDLAFPTY